MLWVSSYGRLEGAFLPGSSSSSVRFESSSESAWDFFSRCISISSASDHFLAALAFVV